MKKKDIAEAIGVKRQLTVYIGRFSPFHNGHAEVLLRALRLSQKVLVIIGSAKQPRRVKNPWTAPERGDIIMKWYLEEFKKDPTLGQLVIDHNGRCLPDDYQSQYGKGRDALI